jgi:carboxylesterase
VPLLPGAEPFAHDGGPVGVVVSHGFTGTPASLRPWAQHLAAAGFTVRLPRLPGHGTTWPEMNATRWTDWYGEIARAHDELSARCDQVYAMGLSMGGTLVTRLAEERPDGVSGLVLVNPSYGTDRPDARFAKFIAPFITSRPGIGSDIKKPGQREPGYDRLPLKAFVSLQKLWATTVADLSKVTAPVLMYRSRIDHVVEPSSGRILIAGATSSTVREIILEDSYHVATMDNDAPQIFQGSVDFVAGLVSASSGGGR